MEPVIDTYLDLNCLIHSPNIKLEAIAFWLILPTYLGT